MVGERTVASRGVKDATVPLPTESSKPGTYGLTETEATTTEPVWNYTRPSAYMLLLFSLEFLLDF